MSSAWYDEIPLTGITDEQWEMLCDGCGQCCLVKIWVGDNIKSCAVACKLFDTKQGRCSDYINRQRRVSDCVRLAPSNVLTNGLLPRTCAYRLRAEGKPLPDWHYLKSGDRSMVHRLGIGVVGRVTHTEADVGVRDYARYAFGEDAWND